MLRKATAIQNIQGFSYLNHFTTTADLELFCTKTYTILENKLPPEITWRKDKIGFEPPQKNWMQTKRFEDFSMAAKQKLVDEKVLSQKVLVKKVNASDAHASNNFDWRYITAAQFL